MDMTNNTVGLSQIVKPLVNDGVELQKSKERMVFAQAKLRFSTERMLLLRHIKQH